MVLTQSKTQTASSRFQTWISNFIFYDDNYHAMCASVKELYDRSLMSSPVVINEKITKFLMFSNKSNITPSFRLASQETASDYMSPCFFNVTYTM